MTESVSTKPAVAELPQTPERGPFERPYDRPLAEREVRYRASYRGTLELDHLCRALLPDLPNLSDAQIEALRALLNETEGNLMTWLVEKTQPVPPAHAAAADLLWAAHVRARARKLAEKLADKQAAGPGPNSSHPQ